MDSQRRCSGVESIFRCDGCGGPTIEQVFTVFLVFAHRSMHGVLNGYSNRRWLHNDQWIVFCSNTHAHDKSFQRTRRPSGLRLWG